MFLKAIPKKDRGTGTNYTYYRLCGSFRLGASTRTAIY